MTTTITQYEEIPIADANLVPVKSSSISHVGYNTARKILFVRFNNGGVYAYRNVPEDQHKLLLESEADSLGKHFQKVIRPVFKGLKVEELHEVRHFRVTLSEPV